MQLNRVPTWIRRKALPLGALAAFGFLSVSMLQLPAHPSRLGAIGVLPVLMLERKPSERSDAKLQKKEQTAISQTTDIGGLVNSTPATSHSKRHIYFLKTHKCASTTVQRVLLTFALKHNLSIALPLNNNNNFYPAPFRPDISKRTCSHPRFDIMAAHTRYHASASLYMANDTFFLSIVRNPASHMDSVFDYFLIGRCPRFWVARTSFPDYLERLIKVNPRPYQSVMESACHFDQLRALQLHDFGLDLVPLPTREEVAAKIKEIDAAFHLVLVAEQLDEGLIVLRDMLGWTTDDIVYLKSNFRVGSVQPVANKTREQAYAWNWADKMLYDHFSNKMNATIQSQGAYIQSELEKFRQMQASLYNACVSGVEVVKPPPLSLTNSRSQYAMKSSAGVSRREATLYMTSYSLTEIGKRSNSCQLAAMSEQEIFKHMNALNPQCNGSDDNPKASRALSVVRQQPTSVLRPSFPYSNGISPAVRVSRVGKKR